MTRLDPLQTALGVGLGVVADVAFKAAKMPDFGSPVEHTHIGLAAVIGALEVKKARSVGLGFGTTLIAEDLFYGNVAGVNVGTSQDRQFSIGLDALEVGVLLVRQRWRR